MITIEDLRTIHLLRELNDQDLEALIPLLEQVVLGAKEVIFDQGEEASKFYMLKKGKALMRVVASPSTAISLGSLKPGYSMGWAALVGDETHFTQAVCVDPCEVFTVDGAKFVEHLKNSGEAGFKILMGVTRIIENRLKRRTDQLVKTMYKQTEL